MKTERHFQIMKRVICDLVDGECTDELPVKHKMTPDCKDCKLYKDWKSTSFDLKSYLQRYLPEDR